MKAYRIIRDQPIAICVGFKPENEEVSEHEINFDDGVGENVFIVDNEVNLTIHDTITDPDGETRYPEPDLNVFRSQEDYDTWRYEMGEI